MLLEYVPFFEKCKRKYKSRIKQWTFIVGGVFPMRLKSEFIKDKNTYVKQRTWINSDERAYDQRQGFR